jgi:hypothetical protein
MTKTTAYRIMPACTVVSDSISTGDEADVAPTMQRIRATTVGVCTILRTPNWKQMLQI